MADYGQYNEETGLSIDYRSAWTGVSLAHHKFHEEQAMQLDEFLKILAKPIKTYLQDIEERYPDQLEDATRSANPTALSQLDKIVEEYNGLSREEKEKHNAHIPYWKKCEAVIQGTS